MTCKKTDSAKNTLTQDQAQALYNGIDLQLLTKEAGLSSSDAKEVIKSNPSSIDELPSLDSIDILDAVNEPAFAYMLLYSFIPDGSDLLKNNPRVDQKRDQQNEYVALIVSRTNIDRSYIQKHLRNALVAGYKKTPEDLLHEVASGKENLRGLGIVEAIISGAITGIASLFKKGSEDKSTVGYQNFLATVDRGKIFPSKSEMTLASDKWEAHFKNAVAASYDPTTGTWSSTSDDWKGAVTSLTPITANVFKGSGEHGTLMSAVNSQALQAAYVAQTAPAATDFSGQKVSPQTNVTGDPAYMPPSDVPWYKTTGGMIGIGVGVLAVGTGAYALSQK